MVLSDNKKNESKFNIVLHLCRSVSSLPILTIVFAINIFFSFSYHGLIPAMATMKSNSSGQLSDINNIFVEQLTMQNTSIYGKWILSNDTHVDSSVRIYRPWIPNTPLEEGMQGIEIKDNGDFIMYGFDRSDRPSKISGKYKLEDSIIEVNLENNQTLSMEIISATKDVLKIKTHY